VSTITSFTLLLHHISSTFNSHLITVNTQDMFAVDGALAEHRDLVPDDENMATDSPVIIHRIAQRVIITSPSSLCLTSIHTSCCLTAHLSQ
jgi:hypothetical protein